MNCSFERGREGEWERRRDGERERGTEGGSWEVRREGGREGMCGCVGVYVNVCEGVWVCEYRRSGGGCECVRVCMFGLRTRAR
jgi:hypothetical protein